MYWLRRPPYLRWAGAALVLIVAAGMELAPQRLHRIPFAADDIEAGTKMADRHIEWRELPAGIFAAVDPEGSTAAHTIAAGDPILRSALRSGPAIPPGWLGVPMQLPARAVPGTSVRLIAADSGMTVEGIVLEGSTRDVLGLDRPGLVAVSAADAGPIAAASTRESIAVVIAP